jgi:hypothetical protein
MKLAIMQPYFFPYIGYFQLMNAVDEFVIYDNIEFTKKGWINRNRILVNGQASFITIPLRKDSDYLDVRDRFLADSWSLGRRKMLNRIAESYRKAPMFDTVYPMIVGCIQFEEPNLFRFILNSLNQIKEYLGIDTSLLISSTLPIDHALKAERKVIAICKENKAGIYLNPPGGINLYEKETFRREGIDLHFLGAKELRYRQFNNDFVPSLSIIDVIMFNPRDVVTKMLESYILE